MQLNLPFNNNPERADFSLNDNTVINFALLYNYGNTCNEPRISDESKDFTIRTGGQARLQSSVSAQ